MSEIASIQPMNSPLVLTAEQALSLYATRTVIVGEYQFLIREISPRALQNWQTGKAESETNDIDSMISLLGMVLYNADGTTLVPAEFIRALPIRLVKEWSDLALDISGFGDSPETQKKISVTTPSD